jgi:hypothetical protein
MVACSTTQKKYRFAFFFHRKRNKIKIAWTYKVAFSSPASNASDSKVGRGAEQLLLQCMRNIRAQHRTTKSSPAVVAWQVAPLQHATLAEQAQEALQQFCNLRDGGTQYSTRMDWSCDSPAAVAHQVAPLQDATFAEL